MGKINKYILSLISSYTTGEITRKEFKELQDWLNENPENKEIFSDYLYFYKKARRIQFIESIDKGKAWNEINLKLETPILSKGDSTQKVKPLWVFSKVFRYAAAIILFLAVGYLFQTGVFTNREVIASPSGDITLQLDNGKVEIINENGVGQIMDNEGNVVAVQNGIQLVYNSDNEARTLIYNTLTVPYGKRSKVQLSDGTIINLNAGTSLRFPVKFMEGQNREVFIESGEAYFDVVEDSKHPFIVNANDVNVRVLGTQFNVSSYPEDENISTLLIEGSVSIYNKTESFNEDTATLLEPGFKADWNKNDGNLNIEEADIEIHTAWINGKIIFKHVPFDNIIKKIRKAL